MMPDICNAFLQSMTSVSEQQISKEVDGYLAALNDDRRHTMTQLREMVFEIWPDAVENMGMKLPTYHLNGHAFLYMADRKNYIAVYVVAHDLLNAFKTELRQYDHGRSCIRFKKLDGPLRSLLGRIIRYTGGQLSTSRYFKNGNGSLEGDRH
jgi:uncharacterized protein YdhG (YjbR/CyaY superfamily)